MINRAPTGSRRCDVCGDDGWYEVWDDVTDQIVANRECPHLHEDWHLPFNATGLLPEAITSYPELSD